jgi:hypothetical protein
MKLYEQITHASGLDKRILMALFPMCSNTWLTKAINCVALQIKTKEAYQLANRMHGLVGFNYIGHV